MTEEEKLQKWKKPKIKFDLSNGLDPIDKKIDSILECVKLELEKQNQQ